MKCKIEALREREGTDREEYTGGGGTACNITEDAIIGGLTVHGVLCGF